MKAEPQASGVLPGILADVSRRLAARQAERPEWERRAASARRPPDFAAALRTSSVGVIGEVKRRSPSAGAIREGADAVLLAREYAAAGAAAISVLTEESHFGGSLADLERVAAELPLPALRKDFVVDALQVFEARALGAAAVLLIVRVLGAEKLAELTELAHRIGLATLVEVHEAAELEAAVRVRPTAIGVNARDLDTLAVDVGRVAALIPRVPADLVAVAESGIATRADVERVAAIGVDSVLVGTSVAGAPSPGAALGALVGVPRLARRASR